MKSAPASFQRMMSDTVLNRLDFADAYIDDAEVDTATSFLQHICELKQVQERLRECKINARPAKCKMAMSTVDFVGSLRAGSLVVVGPQENAKGRWRAGRMERGKVSLHASF